MNLVANKSYRVLSTELHVNTLAQLANRADNRLAAKELMARVVQHMGFRRVMSVKGFIKTAQKRGWSREAAVIAVDFASMYKTEEEFSVEFGKIHHIS
jgi:hypothetical protein